MDEASEYGDAPVKVLAAINRWVGYRDYPGGFVSRLLCNDLIGTVRSADEASLAALPILLRYLHNEVPTQCYGSEDKVTAWGNGPDPATDTDHLLFNATTKGLKSYLDAAHDVGEAKGAREGE
jgi:hypothetical protein